MKKPLLFLSFLFVFSGFVFSQDLTFDDVIKVLDEDFAHYSYVHQLVSTRTDDDRKPSVKITRLPYPAGFDKEGKEQKGEIVYIEIVKDGYRYTMKFDFLAKRETRALYTSDVKSRIYGGLLSDMMPESYFSPTQTQQVANAQPVTAGQN
ncbi:MAG: hypothetical protein LBV68_00650 [Spirochaetaceae bacterium]|jgi:hypothetical protein|nr:hypothetical protein [Spirochaetaceae bacterium]